MKTYPEIKCSNCGCTLKSVDNNPVKDFLDTARKLGWAWNAPGYDLSLCDLILCPHCIHRLGVMAMNNENYVKNLAVNFAGDILTHI